MACQVHSQRMGKFSNEYRAGMDSNLEEGDICVFELIKKQPVVLKVSIFRVVDYAV